MNLDVGDYFTIERGRMIQPPLDTPPFSRPAQYSDDYEGMIFRVLTQEHTFIACEIIFPYPLDGCTTSIDVNGLEIMTLTQQYIEALQTGKQFEPEPQGKPKQHPMRPMLPLVQTKEEQE